jgi:hypothetical protein
MTEEQMVTDQLEASIKSSGRYIDELIQASEKADRKSSGTLFGAGGGIVGAMVGTLAAPLVAVPVIVFTSLATALGIVGGILLYRGPDGIRLERMISKNTIAADEVLRRIKSLPDGAPQSVIDDLWLNYKKLNGAYSNQATVRLEPPARKLNERMLEHKKPTAVDEET